ncbi:MAG: preprotein translocase subunit YajC [Nitrosomonadales bacterium]|jgi:preprotein translocase subunit YajC
MISLAFANSQGAASEGLMGLIPFVIIFILFYFMLIRPQMKQAKAHKQMLEGLKINDEVILNGGILGTINKITDQFLLIKIADNTEIKIQKNAVQTVLDKGTIKSIK